MNESAKTLMNYLGVPIFPCECRLRLLGVATLLRSRSLPRTLYLRPISIGTYRATR